MPAQTITPAAMDDFLQSRGDPAPEPLAQVVADFRQLVGDRGCLAALGEERVVWCFDRAGIRNHCGART